MEILLVGSLEKKIKNLQSLLQLFSYNYCYDYLHCFKMKNVVTGSSTRNGTPR